MMTPEEEREAMQRRVRDFPEQLHAAERMAATAMQTYQTHGERAALRCALGDAASLCDAMARDLNRAYGSKRGKPTQESLRYARCAQLCAEAIWLMRERITMPETAPTVSSAIMRAPPGVTTVT